jgi:RNA recognition motif-containing protein
MSDDMQQNKKKLFVGNLPWSATEAELEEIFAQYGQLVSVSLITDRMSGRSKGFAFVEYETEEAAQAAVDGAEGMEVDGRPMKVNIARPKAPREDRGPRTGGYNRGGGGGGYNRGGGNDRNRSY